MEAPLQMSNSWEWLLQNYREPKHRQMVGTSTENTGRVFNKVVEIL